MRSTSTSIRCGSASGSAEPPHCSTAPPHYDESDRRSSPTATRNPAMNEEKPTNDAPADQPRRIPPRRRQAAAAARRAESRRQGAGARPERFRLRRQRQQVRQGPRPRRGPRHGRGDGRPDGGRPRRRVRHRQRQARQGRARPQGAAHRQGDERARQGRVRRCRRPAPGRHEHPDVRGRPARPSAPNSRSTSRATTPTACSS